MNKYTQTNFPLNEILLFLVKYAIETDIRYYLLTNFTALKIWICSSTKISTIEVYFNYSPSEGIMRII